MLLKNCKILQEGKEVETDILIENGKISKISKDIEGDNPIDLHGKLVMPGIIDPHVHFREPGLTHKEDLFTGSRAAAAGGVTTFFDMPNTSPATLTLDILDEKRELANKSVVNYGFHFGAAVDNLAEIETVKNIPSVKVFMNLSTGKMMIEDEETLKDIFSATKRIAVHAEDDMVEKAIEISKEAGNELYLCHISLKSELDLIRENKTDKMFVEVTPHHLYLTKDMVKDNFLRMKPPLQTKEDQDALWKAINEGLVNTIGSDHAPHTIEEKSGESEVYGIPGVETLLPLMLDAVHDGKITLQKLHELCCHNPAKIFGVKNKGFLKEGYDADLTIVDMALTKKVENQNMFTKCGWSPFDGMELRGWPITTIVNGEVVFDANEFYSKTSGREVEFK